MRQVAKAATAQSLSQPRGSRPVSWEDAPEREVLRRLVLAGGVLGDEPEERAFDAPGATDVDRERVSRALATFDAERVTLGQRLLQSAERGEVHALDDVLAEGCDPDFSEAHDGLAALHWAVMKGQAQAVRVLLQASASASKLDNWGPYRPPAQLPSAWGKEGR